MNHRECANWSCFCKQPVHLFRIIYQLQSTVGLHCTFCGKHTGNFSLKQILQVSPFLKACLEIRPRFDFFTTNKKKNNKSPKCTCLDIFLFVSPHLVSSPMHHFCLLSLVHLSLQLSLLCIHQDGTGQASWPPKETHISVCSLFASVIFPSVETWPLSVHGRIYHSPSPAVLLPGSDVAVTTQPCRSVKV